MVHYFYPHLSPANGLYFDNPGDDYTGRPAPAAKEEGAEGDQREAAASHGISKTGQKILRAQTQPPAPTLFIGNLGFETTEEDIKQLFTAHRRKPKQQDPQSIATGDADKSDDWLRKIRMGTFEDSGLCKGYVQSAFYLPRTSIHSFLHLTSFAFLDFSSVQHATDALVNPKNHHLNGRELKVQFASADAVRRGASKALVAGGARSGPPPPQEQK